MEEVIPWELYEQLLSQFPEPRLYEGSEPQRRHFGLTVTNLASLPAEQQELWSGIAAALSAPELREAVYSKLAAGLACRFGGQAGTLSGYPRPTLFRETEGIEIPPHPDTRQKIVTMHLYLPADRDQLGLGTALYRRKLLAWPFGAWQRRFVNIKQFPFQPNSGYAFVVSNTLTRKSWHGREKLDAGAGVRNTLMNAFYQMPRDGFGGYLGSTRWCQPVSKRGAETHDLHAEAAGIT
jgi:hypothetical protein